jgi:hypothetical protein
MSAQCPVSPKAEMPDIARVQTSQLKGSQLQGPGRGVATSRAEHAAARPPSAAYIKILQRKIERAIRRRKINRRVVAQTSPLVIAFARDRFRSPADRAQAMADPLASSNSPLALTDAQLDAVMRAAAPIAIDRRDAFLRQVAEELSRYVELGDGIVHRVIAQVQRQHFDAPELEEERRGRWSKYA